MSRIESLISATRDRVAARKTERAQSELERIAAERPEGRPFCEALVRPGISVIAEHKRKSPSAGWIRQDLQLEQIVTAYERGGAAALSVLTEHDHFAGSFEDLEAARSATALPLLSKTFHLDAYQLYESKAHGADAVLLVVASLTREELSSLYAEARALDLDALVEVHNAHELEQALEIDADVIGINNRDLATFEVDIEHTFDLLADVPAGKTVVSESGISDPAQLQRLEEAGVDAVLVGEALMRAKDIEAACRVLTQATGSGAEAE